MLTLAQKKSVLTFLREAIKAGRDCIPSHELCNKLGIPANQTNRKSVLDAAVSDLTGDRGWFFYTVRATGVKWSKDQHYAQSALERSRGLHVVQNDNDAEPSTGWQARIEAEVRQEAEEKYRANMRKKYGLIA